MDVYKMRSEYNFTVPICLHQNTVITHPLTTEPFPTINRVPQRGESMVSSNLTKRQNQKSQKRRKTLLRGTNKSFLVRRRIRCRHNRTRALLRSSSNEPVHIADDPMFPSMTGQPSDTRYPRNKDRMQSQSDQGWPVFTVHIESDINQVRKNDVLYGFDGDRPGKSFIVALAISLTLFTLVTT